MTGRLQRAWLPVVGHAQRVALHPAARRFDHALRHPQKTQRALLRTLLRQNAQTEFGRRHGFAELQTLEAYQRRVPFSTYPDYEPLLARARDGVPNLLTREPIRAFEPTSGSGGAQKTIPYTRRLLAEFQHATSAWVFDLLTGWPSLQDTQHYWSISPGIAHGETPGGIPIGLEDDTEYLGFLARLAARTILAVPGHVSRAASMDDCRHQTARHLLQSPDLGFISVWSPTFLTLLFDHIEANFAALRQSLPERARRRLPSRFHPTEVWPKLTLVSCWAHAASAHFLGPLRAWLPTVPIQPKGLLATEGVTSIPLHRFNNQAALAINSHVIELLDPAGHAHAAWEAQPGRAYEIVLTTGGGLYRYRTFDRVRVVGWAHRTPLVEFIGRTDHQSDLCGEKLTESDVARALRTLPREPSFSLLTPQLGAPPHYTLWLESPTPDAPDPAPPDPAPLDAALRQSHHYDRCRALGQLGPLQVRLITGGASRYEARCLKDGMRAGDLKPRLLDPRTDWQDHLICS